MIMMMKATKERSEVKSWSWSVSGSVYGSHSWSKYIFMSWSKSKSVSGSWYRYMYWSQRND